MSNLTDRDPEVHCKDQMGQSKCVKCENHIKNTDFLLRRIIGESMERKRNCEDFLKTVIENWFLYLKNNTPRKVGE